MNESARERFKSYRKSSIKQITIQFYPKDMNLYDDIRRYVKNGDVNRFIREAISEKLSRIRRTRGDV